MLREAERLQRGSVDYRKHTHVKPSAFEPSIDDRVAIATTVRLWLAAPVARLGRPLAGASQFPLPGREIWNVLSCKTRVQTAHCDGNEIYLGLGKWRFVSWVVLP